MTIRKQVNSRVIEEGVGVWAEWRVLGCEGEGEGCETSTSPWQDRWWGLGVYGCLHQPIYRSY